MIRLFLSGRWMGYLALTVVFSAVASLFGLWQWDRRQAAVAVIERVEAHYDQPPVPLDELDLTPAGVSDNEWRTVALAGRYLAEEETLVRTRPRQGQVGFEILVPLAMEDGRVIVVNRGWVPTGATRDAPDVVPPVPEGEVELVGRVRPPEPALPGRSAPEGQIPSIDVAGLEALLGRSLETAFYLERVSETPPASLNPVPALRPAPDEGPHLSYTLQWFLFAIMAFVAYGWLLRSDYLAATGQARPNPRRTDADEEDAILEGSPR